MTNANPNPISRRVPDIRLAALVAGKRGIPAVAVVGFVEGGMMTKIEKLGIAIMMQAAAMVVIYYPQDEKFGLFIASLAVFMVGFTVFFFGGHEQ
jgi:hypothetical protein